MADTVHDASHAATTVLHLKCLIESVDSLDLTPVYKELSTNISSIRQYLPLVVMEMISASPDFFLTWIARVSGLVGKMK